MNAKGVKGFDCLYRSTSGNLFYNIQLRVKKRDGSRKRRLVNLNTNNLEEAVKQIRKRELYKKFSCSNKEKRAKMRRLTSSIKEVKYLYDAQEKLQDNIELFQWQPWQGIPKASINKDLISLNYSNGKFEFNPKWVARSSDLNIIKKIRTFVI